MLRAESARPAPARAAAARRPRGPAAEAEAAEAEAAAVTAEAEAAEEEAAAAVEAETVAARPLATDRNAGRRDAKDAARDAGESGNGEWVTMPTKGRRSGKHQQRHGEADRGRGERRGGGAAGDSWRRP